MLLAVNSAQVFFIVAASSPVCGSETGPGVPPAPLEYVEDIVGHSLAIGGGKRGGVGERNIQGCPIWKASVLDASESEQVASEASRLRAITRRTNSTGTIYGGEQQSSRSKSSRPNDISEKTSMSISLIPIADTIQCYAILPASS